VRKELQQHEPRRYESFVSHAALDSSPLLSTAPADSAAASESVGNQPPSRHQFGQISVYPNTNQSASGTATATGPLTLQRQVADQPVGSSVFGPQPTPTYGPFLPNSPSTAAPPSLALESSLKANPERLEFGADVAGDVGTLVQLSNHGVSPLMIKACTISNGDQVFLATLLDAPNLEPGGQARVAIEYRPDFYAGQQATLLVNTNDGATLRVPLSGPPAEEMVSRNAGGLETYPQAVRFAPQNTAGYGEYQRVVLRNRGLNPINVGKIDAYGSSESPFMARIGTRDLEVAPGRDVEVEVAFQPTQPGSFTDVFYVMDRGGQHIYGSFYASGEGTTTATTSNDQEPNPDPESCQPLEPTVERERGLAHRALQAWDNAVESSTQRAYANLRQEWIEYLTYTSLDPTISPATVPDSSVLRSVLSNGFGNFIADVGINVEERITPRVASVTQRLLTRAALGSDITFHQASKAALLLAGGAGFVVGVLIETAAGLLFDWLFPDDTVEKAMQEAYDQGKADGAQITGEAIQAKVGDLDQAQSSATSERNRQERQLTRQLEQACHVDALQQMSTELETMTQQANAMQPQVGAISRGLLGLWVRDHAVNTKHADKAVDKQWQKATEKLSEYDPEHFGKGEVRNQPDLFVAQCMHEWGQRGLKAPPEFQAALYDEIGADNTALSDATQASGLATQFQRHFSGREFVWDGRTVQDEKFEKGLPRSSDRRAEEHWSNVACKPVLKLENGSCIVERFDYRVVKGVHDLQLRTYPGDARWHGLEDRRQTSDPPEHAQSEALFEYMAHMKNLGFEIHQEADATSNADLQAQFGDQVTIPTVQHADGRPEPITVYRAINDPALSKDLLRQPYDLRGIERQLKGQSTLFRAGNVILVLEEPSLSTIDE
jgi:hypothetical protein